MPAMTLQVLGLREQVARVERMSDFKGVGKPAVQAALDVYKSEASRTVKHLTGAASRSMGTHIHSKKWGVYGNAGPRGTSRFAEGYLAATFLESGTGIAGPLKKRIQAKHVMVFPGAATVKERFGASALNARGKYRARRFGNAGLAFTHSSAGMKPEPWAARAHSAARGKARSEFEKALRKSMAEASHV